MDIKKELKKMPFTNDEVTDITPIRPLRSHNICSDGDAFIQVARTGGQMNYINLNEIDVPPKRGDVCFDIEQSIMKYYDGDLWLPILTPISIA